MKTTIARIAVSLLLSTAAFTAVAAMPGVRVELADTARHFVMYDEPEWMYARIDQFLR